MRVRRSSGIGAAEKCSDYSSIGLTDLYESINNGLMVG
jgi:hypothetical protein